MVFKQGHIAWNKGLKGYTNKGSFKKGMRNPDVALRNKRIEIREKLSDTRKRLFKEGKLISPFQTDKNPSKLGLSNSGQFTSDRTKGENNWNWQGGKTKLYSMYRGEDWDKIRIKVWQRDYFTCQDCGKSGIKIVAHHIKPYEKPEDNFLENLITLCQSCHMKRHNKDKPNLKRNVRKMIHHSL
jgi:hypothetical protein